MIFKKMKNLFSVFLLKILLFFIDKFEILPAKIKIL